MTESTGVLRCDYSDDWLFEDSGSEYKPTGDSESPESDSSNEDTTVTVQKSASMDNNKLCTSTANENAPSTTNLFRGRKRRRNPRKWKQSIHKELKTAGKNTINHGPQQY